MENPRVWDIADPFSKVIYEFNCRILEIAINKVKARGSDTGALGVLVGREEERAFNYEGLRSSACQGGPLPLEIVLKVDTQYTK